MVSWTGAQTQAPAKTLETAPPQVSSAPAGVSIVKPKPRRKAAKAVKRETPKAKNSLVKTAAVPKKEAAPTPEAAPLPAVPLTPVQPANP